MQFFVSLLVTYLRTKIIIIASGEGDKGQVYATFVRTNPRYMPARDLNRVYHVPRVGRTLRYLVAHKVIRSPTRGVAHTLSCIATSSTNQPTNSVGDAQLNEPSRFYRDVAVTNSPCRELDIAKYV